ncbi:MAG TPA: xanthine dehydrogenase family protein molybdopterin-binding subunit [Chloroflexota bacterium]|nr:xanthine dehydrogenase family protein molybdopterin-binding subunit [Chloroflexota bacterium]
MAMTRIDPLRVAQDDAYARSLTDDEWLQLSHDATWQAMLVQTPELVTRVLANHGHKLPGFFVSDSEETDEEGEELFFAANEAVPDFKIIGKPIPRVQGLGIVTNMGQYTENMVRAGMLFTRTLRSMYPHAKITKVDTSKAEKVPGVHYILHRGNLPPEYQDVSLGSGPPFRYIFNEEVYEVGSPIAVVAAESEHIADEAMRQIEVEYQVLPAVVDLQEAMKSSTPKQWDNKLDGTILSVSPPLVRGNPDQAKADKTIELVANKPVEQHVALELTNSLSWWENDRLIMYYTSQWAHGVRQNLSQMLKIPQNRIRVIQPGWVGSGYGYRSGIDLSEVHAAILAKLTGRPVRNTYTRYEDFVTRTHRNQFRNEIKMGVNNDGSIQFANYKVYANVGAQRAAAANGSWINWQVLYKIPNLKLEAVDVFTNSYKSGPYRCVSHPNGTFALELTMDHAASAIGMDPVDFRLKNLNEDGNPDNKKPFSNPGIRDCIQQAADKIGWKNKYHAPKAKEVRPGVYHGIGLAAHACSHGAGGQPATGQVILNTDGTIQAVSATNDIGDGQRTEMMMIAAESLGVPYNAMSISTAVDTDFTTDNSGTFGSQQTNTGGRGMYEAAQDLKKKLLTVGAAKFAADAKKAGKDLSVKPEDLDVVDGYVVHKTDPSLKSTLGNIATFAGGPMTGSALYRQDPKWERIAWGAHAAEIEVDTMTGGITILNYVAAHDVGRALNPFALEQQIEGGVVMATGAALTEEMLIDKATGLPLNGNLLDYKPLSIKDAPLADVILVEHPKEYGTFGAHGIGEPPMAMPAPAIANAIYNAIGVWITEPPFTREKIQAALKGA